MIRSADLRSGAFLNGSPACRVGDRRSGGSVEMRKPFRLVYFFLAKGLRHGQKVRFYFEFY
jgi:hypothetical protein